MRLLLFIGTKIAQESCKNLQKGQTRWQEQRNQGVRRQPKQGKDVKTPQAVGLSSAAPTRNISIRELHLRLAKRGLDGFKPLFLFNLGL